MLSFAKLTAVVGQIEILIYFQTFLFSNFRILGKIKMSMNTYIPYSIAQQVAWRQKCSENRALSRF